MSYNNVINVQIVFVENRFQNVHYRFIWTGLNAYRFTDRFNIDS